MMASCDSYAFHRSSKWTGVPMSVAPHFFACRCHEQNQYLWLRYPDNSARRWGGADPSACILVPPPWSSASAHFSTKQRCTVLYGTGPAYCASPMSHMKFTRYRQASLQLSTGIDPTQVLHTPIPQTSPADRLLIFSLGENRCNTMPRNSIP